MMKTMFKVTLLGIVALFFASCSGNELEKNIPKDAAFVVKVDGDRLTSKSLKLTDLLNPENLKKLFSEKESDFSKFLNSGVELSSQFYGYAVKSQSGKPAFCMLVPISNVEDFKKTLSEIKNDKFKITADGTDFIAENGSVTIKFNDKKALVATGNDTKTNTANAKAYFNVTEEASLIASSENYKSFASTASDLSFWANYTNVSQFSNLNGTGLTPEMLNMTKDMYLGYNLNFENGEIKFDSKVTTNEKYANLVNGILGDGVKSGVLENHPCDKNVALMAVSLNFDGVVKALDEYKMSESIDQMLRIYVGPEINLKSLNETLTGDLVLSVQSFDVSSPMPFFAGALSLGVKDKAKADALLTSISKSVPFLVGDKGNYKFMGMADVNTNASSLVISGMGDFTKKPKLEKEVAEKAAKNTSFICVDFTKLSEANLASLSKEQVSFVKEFEKLEATGGKLDDKFTSSSNASIFMKNKEDNSLRVIIDASIKLSESMKKQNKMVPDTTNVAAPDSTMMQ